MNAKRNKKKVVDKRFARKGEYEQVISAIEEEGECPFCPQNFKYHKNPVLKKRGAWFITKSSWPYKNAAYHLLIIGEKHKEKFKELSPEDWENITFLVKWAIAKFRLAGGGFAMRFGDTMHTGATVCHIHGHLVVPKVSKDKSETVIFPIG